MHCWLFFVWPASVTKFQKNFIEYLIWWGGCQLLFLLMQCQVCTFPSFALCEWIFHSMFKNSCIIWNPQPATKSSSVQAKQWKRSDRLVTIPAEFVTYKANLDQNNRDSSYYVIVETCPSLMFGRHSLRFNKLVNTLTLSCISGPVSSPMLAWSLSLNSCSTTENLFEKFSPKMATPGCLSLAGIWFFKHKINPSTTTSWL